MNGVYKWIINDSNQTQQNHLHAIKVASWRTFDRTQSFLQLDLETHLRNPNTSKMSSPESKGWQLSQSRVHLSSLYQYNQSIYSPCPSITTPFVLCVPEYPVPSSLRPSITSLLSSRSQFNQSFDGIKLGVCNWQQQHVTTGSISS